MLWGLGVGYVISGMYFGWNLGLEEGGTLGLAIATFFIIIMYVTFTFSYTELACAIPKAVALIMLPVHWEKTGVLLRAWRRI
jgi:ethanolamine permease